MTNASRRTIEAMQALAGQDLQEAGNAQIRAEFAEDALEPAGEARHVAEVLDTIVSKFMRDRASAAKAVRAATAPAVPLQRPTVKRMRALIRAAFDAEPQLAAAFRDGKAHTDADVRSLYDDLVALGKIAG
jgi:hypothetical protein